MEPIEERDSDVGIIFNENIKLVILVINQIINS